MRVVLVSDAHLNGPNDPNQAQFIAWLARLPSVDRLCILGDLFQHWWDFQGEPFVAYKPVVAALADFPLSFVPGNHDWRAGEWLKANLKADTGTSLRYTWDGLRVHLAHGDAADTSRGYALISRLLRGPSFAALMDRLGPERGWQLLAKIAGKPHRYRPANPLLLAAQRRIAEQLLEEEDVDLVAFGHSHSPELVQLRGGMYANLGDRLHHHSELWVVEGVPELRPGAVASTR